MKRVIFTELSIIKGDASYMDSCVKAIDGSELHDNYFSDEGFTRRSLTEGFEKNLISVALLGETVVGFVWVIPQGAFHAFPYIHILAVNGEYRSRGIGKELLAYVEREFAEFDKFFLCSSSERSKKFYEKNGYVQVGTIPDLYRKGVEEHIMMRRK